MATDEFVYLYPYSLKEARRIDGNEWPPWKTTSDVELWRDSFRENIHRNIECREESDLILCCKAKNALFNTFFNDIGGTLLGLDPNHKSHSADTYNTLCTI